MRSPSILKKLGLLPFSKKVRSSSISKKNWGRLPFSKKIEVVFHLYSSWVEIRLHTKNQPPRLPWTAQIVIIPGVVCWCGGVVCGLPMFTPLVECTSLGPTIKVWQNNHFIRYASQFTYGNVRHPYFCQ